MADDRSLLQAALGDGRSLIAVTGFSLALSGGFAFLQSISGELLPHDSHAIGMDAVGLARAGNHRLLGFMFHDRVAYGGSLLAIGFGYMWLAAFPMAGRAVWAWWSLVFSGAIGFLAFLTYLGQGYLDTWHGVATLLLLPVFAGGMWRSRPQQFAFGSIWKPEHKGEDTFARCGRMLLVVTAAGLVLAGITIAIFGMTTVFVPSDLRFIGLDVFTLRRISPMLVPVISHDRAGFGGGLCSIGTFLLLVARCAELNRSLVEIIAIMGCTGFGCAIGVHFAVGYLDFLHLLPAFIGFAFFIIADVLLWMGRVNSFRSRQQRRPMAFSEAD
jgi:hypothetical protein